MKIDSRILNRINKDIDSDADENISIIILSKNLDKLKNNKLMKNCNCKIKYKLDLINAVAVEMPASSIQKLSKIPEIKFIAEDSQVQTQMDVVRGTVSCEISEDKGLDGSGIGIAVLDTGIYPHEDLVKQRNRIVAFADFVNNLDAPYDDNGHGTHVAGIVCGDGYSSRGKYRGIAPNADIIGVKVMNKDGGGSTSDIVAGMQWVVENKEKYNIRVVSLSLGSSPDLRESEDPLVSGVNELWRKGLVVVTAAGNSGPEKETINSPGISNKVITVGCSDSNGTVDFSDDTIAEFSSRGPTAYKKPKPDIVAPGVKVHSLKSVTNYVPSEKKTKVTSSSYAIESGTSMSTPVVSGAIALLLQKEPNLTPDAVKRKILKSTKSLPRVHKNDQGKGVLDMSLLLS